MPTPPSLDPLPAVRPVDPISSSVACPQLLTPPPERDEAEGVREVAGEHQTSLDAGNNMRRAVDDNTAHGMSYAQEESMYTSHETMSQNEIMMDAQTHADAEKMVTTADQNLSAKDDAQNTFHNNILQSLEKDNMSSTSPTTVSTMDGEVDHTTTASGKDPGLQADNQDKMNVDQEVRDDIERPSSKPTSNQENQRSAQPQAPGPPANGTTNGTTDNQQLSTPPPTTSGSRNDPPYPSTPSWDFTNTPLSTAYPSSLLRPGSKFTGTQQSDYCDKGEDKVCENALDSSCSVLECDDKRLIPRTRLIKAREAMEPPKPAIHYGTIASGDTVMRSGEDRDEIARKEKVIGFEMEGAGIWDSFPCVIIKGVCDYADSHKNKEWQEYAAATAASCMKAFLGEWDQLRRSQDQIWRSWDQKRSWDH